MAVSRRSDCGRIQESLWDHLAGVLSEEQTNWISAHLSSCQACTELAQRLRAVLRGVELDRDTLVEWTPAPWSSIEQRLTGRRIIHTYPRAAAAVALAAVACACCLALAGAFHFRPQEPMPVAQEPGRRDGAGPQNDRHHPMFARAPLQVKTAGRSSDAARRHPMSSSQSPFSQDTGETPERPVRDDLADLNQPSSTALAEWSLFPPDEVAILKSRVDETLRKTKKGDDFVEVPFPRLASRTQETLAAAAAEYQREKEIVDPRLARRVTVAQKCASLAELCRDLSTTTGIDLRADRTVEDENVTLFCEDQPLREVMRQINRLFGYHWGRSGEEGSYRYELRQDLRGRLMEEEMRNHDVHEALIALDEKLRALHGNVDGWKSGALRVYEMLTPAQTAAMENGQQVWLSTAATDPDSRIPGDLRGPLMQAFNLFRTDVLGQTRVSSGRLHDTDTPLADVSDSNMRVGLQIDRSEAGTLSLKVDFAGSVGPVPGPQPYSAGPTPALLPRIPQGVEDRFGMIEPLASAKTPTAQRPDNARRQAAHRAEPAFQKTVRIAPVSSCLHFTSAGGATRLGKDVDLGSGAPHVLSGDVWEAVHRETHRPIIADAYSRFYPTADVTVRSATLFDGLCHDCDQMGMLWKQDDEFLQVRSASFVWDKLKEVPRRLLVRWKTDAQRDGGLPLDDLLEMAGLSDQQLDSAVVGRVVEHCWDLPEWSTVGNGYVKTGLIPQQLRQGVRLVASLDPAQRAQGASPDGILIGSLRPAQRQMLASTHVLPVPYYDPAAVRLRVDYVPAGQYVWHPVIPEEEASGAEKWRMVGARTPEEALAAAQRVYPAADPGQIIRSSGEFSIVLIAPNGQVTQMGRLIVIRSR